MSLPSSIRSAPNNIALIKQYAKSTGIPIRAVLGDYSGKVRLASRTGVTDDEMTKGLYYARIPNGYSAEGTSTLGDLIVVRANGNVQPEYNLPVMVREIPSAQGIYEIVGYDIQTLANRGKNVSQYMESRAVLSDVWLRQVWDGREFPLQVAGAYTTKTFTYDYRVWTYSGTLRNMRIDSTTPEDYADDFPASAANETLALSYFDTVDGTSGYVVLDEQTIADDYNSADAQTLISMLPHQLCMPKELWRLSGGYGQIDQTQWRGHARQFQHIPLPSGLPNHITRNWIYLAIG